MSKKNKDKIIKFSVVVFITSIVLGCSNSDNPTNSPQISAEGMSLIKSTKSTVSYVKEGVDFSEYDKVLILPSAVAFKKNWKRDYNRNSSHDRIQDKDVLRIKAGVTSLFDEVFKEEFGKDAKFSIVDVVGSNTLIIRPAVINLDIVAPDLRSASNVKTYANETGDATLFLELYDGVSGEILARVVSASLIGDNGYRGWANRLTNTVDAKRTIRKWAKALRIKYDEAHMPKAH